MCDCGLTSLGLAIRGLCVGGSSVFRGSERSLKVGLLLCGTGVKPIYNFLPIASCHCQMMVDKQARFWMNENTLFLEGYLFFFQGCNYELCHFSKYLQAPGAGQLSLYCYTKVNTTFF